MRRSLLLCCLLFSMAFALTRPLIAAEKNANRIKPYAKNPRYWQYKGKPVLLLGGSKDDSLFQRPDLKEHLDDIKAAGGNYIRNTMSDRHSTKNAIDTGTSDVFNFEVYPYAKLSGGKYDLNRWNDEYWKRFANLLKWTNERDIIVQIEIWDRFDFTDFRKSFHWRAHPYNPTNNVNYTSAQSGLATVYSKQHPSRDKQPFFHTIPGMEKYQKKYDVIRKYQERFIEKLLSHSLPYGNVLYCMNNETSTGARWGQHWIKFIRSRAKARDVDVYATDMFDDGFSPEKSKKIRLALDSPKMYDFLDISQVNSRTFNEDHWDKLRWYNREIKKHPRPLNNTKIYGSGNTSWGSGSPEDGVERFWRDIFAGCASARFHRNGAGNGLKPIAKASLTAARKAEKMVRLWDIHPRNDLLQDRKRDEAYLTCRPGKSYLLYFTDGGSVGLNLKDHRGTFNLQWINIATGANGSRTKITGGQIARIAAPKKNPWVAVIKLSEGK